jgi:hypothetical protein
LGRKLLVAVAAGAVVAGGAILALSWHDLHEQRRSEAARLLEDLGVMRAAADDLAAFASMKDEVGRCAPGRPVLLVLDLEGVHGGLRVREVRADPPASVALRETACIAAALRGRIVPVPNVELGRRWHVTLPVGSASSPTATPAR